MISTWETHTSDYYILNSCENQYIIENTAKLSSIFIPCNINPDDLISKFITSYRLKLNYVCHLSNRFSPAINWSRFSFQIFISWTSLVIFRSFRTGYDTSICINEIIWLVRTAPPVFLDEGGKLYEKPFHRLWKPLEWCSFPQQTGNLSCFNDEETF